MGWVDLLTQQLNAIRLFEQSWCSRVTEQNAERWLHQVLQRIDSALKGTHRIVEANALLARGVITEPYQLVSSSEVKVMTSRLSRSRIG